MANDKLCLSYNIIIIMVIEYYGDFIYICEKICVIISHYAYIKMIKYSICTFESTLDFENEIHQ